MKRLMHQKVSIYKKAILFYFLYLHFFLNSILESAKIWEAFFYLGVIPAVIIGGLMTVPKEIEEVKHKMKEYEEHGPPKFVEAPYLRKRTSVSLQIG